MKKRSTKKLVLIGVLASVSAVLMFLEFPLWFAPDFYKMDFSEVPVLIGAFAYGPMAGVVIEAVKILVKTAITGSTTGGIGELANFLIGISLVIPASFIYMRRKTKKTAVLGLGVGVIVMVVVGTLLNAFVLLPVYALVYSTPENIVTVSDFVFFGSLVNPLVTNLTSFLMFAVAPFNLVKGIFTSVIVVLIYKQVSGLLKAEDSESV